MAQAPMPAYVKLLVQDPQRSKAFYESLGFSLVHTDPVFTHMRWAEHADVFLVSTPTFLTLDSPRGRGVLLCFSAGPSARKPEISEIAASALAQGAQVDGPRTEPWFTRELIVTDPDGYRLNFVEPASSGQAGNALAEAS